MIQPKLSIKNITKVYPGVVALDNFSLDIYPGEIHALLGENGAGKSTLIKSISGAIVPDGGTFEFEDGIKVNVVTPEIAIKHGVEVVYQEFNLLSSLTVAENISFGKKLGKYVDYKKMRNIAKNILDLFKVDIDPEDRVFTLPTSKQQIIEIAKAISRDAKILIMDEPTAPLSIQDVNSLFKVLNDLKRKNVAIIYITHRLEEIFEISDKVTVMRDGHFIETIKTDTVSRKELVSKMVGRELTEVFPKKQTKYDETVLEVKSLSGNGVRNINFELKKGEILGFSGLVGSGRTEMVRLLYGADLKETGQIIVNGESMIKSSPRKSIDKKIGFVPEDRKLQGCLLDRDVKTNISLSVLPKISNLGFINRKREKEITNHYMDTLMIKTPSQEQMVRNLSGGNQQKVVISRALAADSEIIIFDEPTRGVDVGAKQEIYKLIVGLAEEGKSIILISSEMEEIIGLSDRIMVLYEGGLSGELSTKEISQEAIMNLASGLRKGMLDYES